MTISRPGILVATLSLLALFWLGGAADRWSAAYPLKGRRTDYYNLLVHGFLDGHLSLQAKVHPDLLSKDPAIRRNAPYLLDAALYQGKYYLYYGVVPAVTLLLPYTLVTGQDLALNVAVLAFVIAGYLVSLRAYALAKRAYFSKAGTAVDAASCALLGFGPMLPYLARRGAFYELPIAAGYACMAVAMLALFQVFHDRRRPLLWLGLASLSNGLAVGCRPNHVFTLPVVAAAGMWLYYQTKPEARRGLARRVFVAAILPAAFIGALLALYNYLRFGNPLDFGFKWGLNAFFDTGKPLASLGFVTANLKWYFLTLPVIGPYFPYVLPINASHFPPGYYSDEAVHGQFLFLCLAVWVAIAAAGLLGKRRVAGRLPLGFLAALAWAGLTNLCFMLVLGVRAERYMADFMAPLTLLVVLAGAFCLQEFNAGAVRRLWSGLFYGGTALVCLADFMGAIELFGGFAASRPDTYRELSYYGNYPSLWLAKVGILKYGPVRFNVRFQPDNRQGNAPLFVTGTPNKTDALYAHQRVGNTVVFQLLHFGYGGQESAPQQIDPTRNQVVEVDLGSLYPPIVHPWYNGWKPEDIRKLKTTARVLLNGKEIIRGRMQTYDSPPYWIHFGRNPAGNDEPFKGEIGSVRRLPPRSASELAGFSDPGWWRARITFPENMRRYGQPLLGSGISGAGNLLFTEVMEKNLVRFGLDQWGAGASFSLPIELDTSREHLLEIFVGPQVAKTRLPGRWNIPANQLLSASNSLNVWIDRQLVWSATVQANQDSYDASHLGQNLQGFSSSPRDYSGRLEPAPLGPVEQREFVLRNLSLPPVQTSLISAFSDPQRTGMWRANATFPKSIRGLGQPLLASGDTGTGNLLYVEMLADDRIRFGLDEWGAGARHSPALAVDTERTHRLEIFVGPQVAKHTLPRSWGIFPGELEAAASKMNVWLDGKLVWSLPITANADSYESGIQLGENLQGFSTAGSEYAGTIEASPYPLDELREFLTRNLRQNRSANVN